MPGPNHLWCRSLELGEINPAPFVIFFNLIYFPGGWPPRPLHGLFWRSSILLNEVQVHPLSMATHSCMEVTLLLEGSPHGRIASHQSGLKKHVLFPAEMPPVAGGDAVPRAGAGRSAAGTARSAWEEKQLSKPGHGHHSGRVSRSAGVEANLVHRHFYTVRK